MSSTDSLPAAVYSGSACLVVFTKIPGLIDCKTRLYHSTPLSRTETERLAWAFLADTIRTARLSTKERLIIAAYPECSKETLGKQLSNLPHPLPAEVLRSIELIEQTGQSFAQRLKNVVNIASSQSSQPVVVIGADSPALSPQVISCALRDSEQGRYVLGPTSQGGLYLIGIPGGCSPESLQLEQAFSHPEKTELQCFSDRIKESGIPVTLLGLHFDVDRGEDLVTLLALLSAVELTSRQKSCTNSSEGVFGQTPTTRAVLDELSLSMRKPTSDNRSVELVRKPPKA